MDIRNISGESCEPTGALSAQILYAKVTDFATLQVPKDICSESGNAAAVLEDLVTISASHAMKPGKKLHSFNYILETGDIDTNMIGDQNQAFSNALKGDLEGSGAKLLGFLRWARRQNLIVFVKEFGSGQVRQFGSALYPARVKAQQSVIEALVEGKNSATVTIQDKQKYPAPIYKGTLDVASDSE